MPVRALPVSSGSNNLPGLPVSAGGARIKTFQAFSITIGSSSTSNTATLGTAVNTTWAHIVFNGYSGGDTTDIRISVARLVLTDSTTVTATRASQDGVRQLTIKGYVIEWEPDSVKSVQQVAITLSSTVTSNTQTINSVNTAKAFLFHTGSSGGASTEIRSAHMTLTLTNQTTVTADRANGTNTGHVTGAVLEFN